MAVSIRAVALAMIGSAAALQLPLISSDNQVHISSYAGGKELVSSEALQSHLHGKNLMKRAYDLFDIANLSMEEYNHPTRVIGSKGHLATIDYIISTIAELGDYYTLSNQSFDAVVGNIFESRLVIDNDVPKTGTAMNLSPPTKNNEPVYGKVVLIPNDGCDDSDYPSLTGSIALIKRGVCPFGDKSALAGKNGAVAAIVYNNNNEKGALGGTLGAPNPYHVATFGISGPEAKVYVEKLQKGLVVDSIAYMDSEVKTIDTHNVVAQTVGGDQDNCVMLGGHSDSVTEGPGINDDGSGSLTLLEIASQLVKYSVNNCVRFAWWAGEEEGLLGSDYYVSQLSEEENMKIRLFMDYDMLGSPNFAYQVYNATNAVNPVGSEELRDLYTTFYEEHDLNYTFIPFDGRSDYDAFIKNGIPGGGIATGAEGVKTKEEKKMFGGTAGEWFDPCYHQICDTPENVNETAWEINTKLVAHSVATYAISFQDFPKRKSLSSVSTAQAQELFPYHGRYLYI